MSHAHAHGHGRGMHHTDGPSRSSMDSAETQGHGHSHVRLDHPGLFEPFAPPSRDDFDARAFTVGIGGPVGSGKTALVLALCRHLRGVKVTSTKTAVPTSSTSTEKNSTNYQEVRDRGAILQNIAVVTNDIFTQEDCEFLVRHNALPLDRLAAVETGGCPHAAIREDISANLSACERMTARHPGLQLILLESGGDVSLPQVNPLIVIPCNCLNNRLNSDVLRVCSLHRVSNLSLYPIPFLPYRTAQKIRISQPTLLENSLII